MVVRQFQLFQQLRGIGQHCCSLCRSNVLLRQNVSVRQYEPPAVDRDLQIIRIRSLCAVGICIRSAVFQLEAYAVVQRMRGKLTGCRILRPEFSASFNVDHAKFHRNHQIAVVAGAALNVTVVVIRIIVILYRHVKGRYQLLHPFYTGELRFLSMYGRCQN